MEAGTYSMQRSPIVVAAPTLSLDIYKDSCYNIDLVMPRPPHL
jgi:hypothetical protein